MTEEQKNTAVNPDDNLESTSEVVVESNKSSSVANPEVVTEESQPALELGDFEATPQVEKQQGEAEGESTEIISLLQQENANLKKLFDEKSAQSDGFKAQYARLAADFDNFRKRTAKEKESLEQQTKKNVITALLPIVDNFERARVQIKPANEGEQAIQNSYQGVYKTLVDCLKKMGVAAMRPEGQEFDPNFHEAMLREATDEHPEGTVIEQLMRGYLLGDLVLRHAMVKVAVPIEPVITSEENRAVEENSADNAESVS